MALVDCHELGQRGQAFIMPMIDQILFIFIILVPANAVHAGGTQYIAVNEGMKKGMRQSRRDAASLLKGCGDAPSKITFLPWFSMTLTISLYVYTLSVAKRAS